MYNAYMLYKRLLNNLFLCKELLHSNYKVHSHNLSLNVAHIEKEKLQANLIF